MSEPKRCNICGWPLAASVADGCVEGNCSQRPVPKCFVCGKDKGQPPERCNGHYLGTSSDPYRVRLRAFEDATRELLAEMTLDDEWGRLEIPKDHPVIVKLRALLEAARG